MISNYEKLAKTLVNYSCKVQKGEKVLIEQKEIDPEFIIALIKEIRAVGGYPFIVSENEMISRELLFGTDEIYAKLKTKYMLPVMKDMDAYIGLRGSDNIFENSDVPSEQKALNNKF
ncbi:MAG: aminopeptidase, partial [Clostridia bacterium]|nr:aminopeptidase [Clostridia bacterium]